MGTVAHSDCGFPGYAMELAEDTVTLAEIFRASIEELTADDYSEGARQAWTSAADDEEAFAKRLSGQLTLIATMNGSRPLLVEVQALVADSSSAGSPRRMAIVVDAARVSLLTAVLERKEGLVINVSSWAGRYASTLTGPGYNATKHAVVALTESLNMEEGANGIRATSILPGEVATPILEKRPVPPPAHERARMLQAEDLGRTILFIATLPARACVNEIVISPTWNRFYVGGLESPKS